MRQGTLFEMKFSMLNKKLLPLCHIVTICTLLAGGSLSQATPRPHTGVIVKKISRTQPQDRSISRFLRSAELSAQKADEVRSKIARIDTMNRFERWTSGVNVVSLQEEYCVYMTDHVRAMAALFRKRSQHKSFKGLREFEYTNTVRKSDYLLTSIMTKKVLEALPTSSPFHEGFLKSLEEYNQARGLHDGKVLHFE